ncbi:LssY C-terminal domain-containing protein [Desulfolithobacter dissulfuricans]
MPGKLAFHRPRPDEAVLLESSYFFPSGHATMAVAFYGFLGYLLIRSAKQWKIRVNLFFLTCIPILLIGLSRIVLGVHYLSDVWSGYLVGTLWLIIGISLSEWLTARGRLDWQYRTEPGRRWLALGLGVAAAIWYLAFAILARDSEALLSSLREAGWYAADKVNLENMIRLVKQGMDCATAPLAPAFWNGRINDFALERPIQRGNSKVVATIRLWQTSYRMAGSQILVGIARGYDGIQWGLLHHILPDVDAAADLFIEALKNGRKGRRSCRLPLVEPVIGRYLMGGRFFARGELWPLPCLRQHDQQ